MSSSSSSASVVSDNPFADQLKAAGLTAVTYEDPNAPISEPVEKPANEADIDVITGASGTNTDYYTNNGGSYWTLDQMVKRANMKYYYSVDWAEATAKSADADKATTLAQAAALANAKYIKAAFPNDGKTYVIKMSGNGIASKTFMTLDKDNNMFCAVFGASALKADNGNYYIHCALTMKTTLVNMVLNGKVKVLVYEYNATSSSKAGPGARNYGCRLDTTVDTDMSYYYAASTATPLTEAEKKITIGETIATNVRGAYIYLKVNKMYTLG